MLTVPKINKYVKSIQRVTNSYSPVDSIRLHASERDLSFESDVWNYFINKLSDSAVRYYPNNDHALELLSQFTTHDKRHLTITDGSDRALRNIFHVFSQPGTSVVTTEPAFPMYKVYADMYGLIYKPQTYNSELFPYDKVYSAIDNTTSIVVLSNPSSPVGGVVDEEFLRDLINKCREVDALLVIDEAYIEFSNAVSFDYIAKTESDVIVVRTASKALGSAGIRIGYTVATEQNTVLLNQIKSMNDITALSILWLETIVQFKDRLQTYIDTVINNRNELVLLCKLYSFAVIPSNTNFLHIANCTFPKEFVTKTYKFPWSDTVYTRLSVPADQTNFKLLKHCIGQLANNCSN